MSFASNIKTQAEFCRTAVTSMQSLREFLNTKLVDLQNISEFGGSKVLTFEKYVEDVQSNCLCQINGDDLKAALDNGDDAGVIHAVYDSAGHTIDVSCDDVTDLFQERVADLQLQKEFVNTVLDENTINAESWSTSVLTKLQGVTPQQVESYAQYFRCGDKWMAMQSWLRTLRAKTYSDENTFISIVSREEYAGCDADVWSALWASIVNPLSELAIIGVINILTDSWNFFNNLWKSIQKLIQWICSKAFHALSTNFEKGGSKIGILDVPLAQVDFGPVTLDSQNRTGSCIWDNVYTASLETIDTAIANENLHLTDDSVNGLNYGIFHDYTYHGAGRSKYISKSSKKMVEIRSKECIQWSDELNDFVYNILDVTWNGNAEWNPDLNLLFRFGCYTPAVTDTSQTPTPHFVMQIFYLCSSNIVDNLTDYQILSNMSMAWQTFITGWATKNGYPLKPAYSGEQYPTLDNLYFSWFYSGTLFKDMSGITPGDDGPINITNYIKLLDPTDWYTFDDALASNVLERDVLLLLMCLSVLPYSLLFSSARKNSNLWYDSGFPKISADQPEVLLMYGWNTNSIVNRDLWVGAINEYIPYCKTEPYGTAVHFQTLEDRRTELGHYVLAMVVAIAAVAILITVHFVKRSLRARTSLARGAADSYAWEHGTNPTAENIREWRRLDKIARKKERISRLFGITTAIATADAAGKGISDKFMKTFSNNGSTEDSIRDVYRAITGNNL